jgi:hypothetical protein
MTEDPTIIKMNIAHYAALLKLSMSDEKRSTINSLLSESRESLESLNTSAQLATYSRH